MFLRKLYNLYDVDKNRTNIANLSYRTVSGILWCTCKQVVVKL